MMIDYDDHFATRREPQFYLPRLLGGKLAVLVVVLVLYLCVRHQLITQLSATVVNLGIAYADAKIMLAMFGSLDAVTTFAYGHKTYDLTRHAIANADLFAQCWRAVVWQIERGTIWAVLLVFAPPFAWRGAVAAWEVWQTPLPEPHPVRPIQTPEPTPRASLPTPSSPLPFVASHPVDEAADTPEPAIIPAHFEVPALPPTAVPKRPRSKKKSNPPDDDVPPPTPPLVQPGQVRKRPKPEA
jgi:hypothetical protein